MEPKPKRKNKPGAGRPPKEQTKKVITFRIDEDLKDFIDSAENRSELINACIRKAKEGA